MKKIATVFLKLYQRLIIYITMMLTHSFNHKKIPTNKNVFPTVIYVHIMYWYGINKNKNKLTKNDY